MDYMYLVGVSWYSADQGDSPNTDEFPSFVSSSKEAAEAEYRRLAQDDKSWGYGARLAYMAKAPAGRNFKREEVEFIHGSLA